MSISTAAQVGKLKKPAGVDKAPESGAFTIVIDGKSQETLTAAHMLKSCRQDINVVICGTEETTASCHSLMVTDVITDVFYNKRICSDTQPEIPSLTSLLFPKHNPNGLWEKLTEDIEKLGGIFQPSAEVTRIEAFEGSKIASVVVSDKESGEENTLQCDILISPRHAGNFIHDAQRPRHITNLYCLSHNAQQWHESSRSHALLSALEAAQRILKAIPKKMKGYGLTHNQPLNTFH